MPFDYCEHSIKNDSAINVNGSTCGGNEEIMSDRRAWERSECRNMIFAERRAAEPTARRMINDRETLLWHREQEHAAERRRKKEFGWHYFITHVMRPAPRRRPRSFPLAADFFSVARVMYGCSGSE